MMVENKVALVTGAGQGVGRGIALALAAEGARVVVAGRTLSKVEDAAREIESRGAEALAVELDVKDAASLAACVEAAVGAFGTIDVLVNNAQEVPLGPLHAVTEERLAAGWESGPLASFRMMKLCHPHLKGDGCIVRMVAIVDPTGEFRL